MMECGDTVCRLQIHHTKGSGDMAVKKRFPYRAALVACNGGCRAVKGERGVQTAVSAVATAYRHVNSGQFF